MKYDLAPFTLACYENEFKLNLLSEDFYTECIYSHVEVFARLLQIRLHILGCVKFGYRHISYFIITFFLV